MASNSSNTKVPSFTRQVSTISKTSKSSVEGSSVITRKVIEEKELNEAVKVLSTFLDNGYYLIINFKNTLHKFILKACSNGDETGLKYYFDYLKNHFYPHFFPLTKVFGPAGELKENNVKSIIILNDLLKNGNFKLIN